MSDNETARLYTEAFNAHARIRELEEENARLKRIEQAARALRECIIEDGCIGAPDQYPSHSHEVPGVWDGGMTPLAFKHCAECALWFALRDALDGKEPGNG